MRLALAVLAALGGCSIQHPPITGRIEQQTFESQILGEPMVLLVHLPADYDGPNLHGYRAVYQLDGLFLDQLGVTAGLASELGAQGRVYEPIVVGIGYAQPDAPGTGRFRDFVPSGAARYLRFLDEEVVPRIELRYRIPPDGERALFGHSLGGLFGLYALFHQPNGFKHIIAGDPTYIEGMGIVFEWEKEGPSPTGSLYVTAGAIGSAEQRAYHEAFTGRLQARAHRQLRLVSDTLQTDHLGAIVPTYRRGLELFDSWVR